MFICEFYLTACVIHACVWVLCGVCGCCAAACSLGMTVPVLYVVYSSSMCMCVCLYNCTMCCKSPLACWWLQGVLCVFQPIQTSWRRWLMSWPFLWRQSSTNRSTWRSAKGSTERVGTFLFSSLHYVLFPQLRKHLQQKWFHCPHILS